MMILGVVAPSAPRWHFLISRIIVPKEALVPMTVTCHEDLGMGLGTWGLDGVSQRHQGGGGQCSPLL